MMSRNDKQKKDADSKKPVDGRFVAGIVFLVGAVIFLAYKIFLLSFIFFVISLAFLAKRISKIVLTEKVAEKQSLKTFEILKKLNSAGLKKPMDAKKYYLNLLKLKFLFEKYDIYGQLGSVYESLAGLMFYGIGTLVNRNSALKYYEKAYDMGCEEAAVDLGNLYLYGVHVEKDIEKAMSYLAPLAEKGNESALEALDDYKDDPEGKNFKQTADVALEENEKKVDKVTKHINIFSVALVVDILLWIITFITENDAVNIAAFIGAVIVGVLYLIKLVGIEAFGNAMTNSFWEYNERQQKIDRDVRFYKSSWDRYNRK